MKRNSALFVTGFATFINLYATQPLLPRFRELTVLSVWPETVVFRNRAER